jgi:RHS repeat-associated protein
LGRLTAQKLAEVNATLNDAGTYVGAGGSGAQWGDVFTYDERSNLTSRTDARGVKTVYSYNNDPLNRLQSVSWDTSGFGDTSNPILPAATVSYQYRQKSTGIELKDITQLESVTTAGVSTESYTFDAEGRVGSKTLTLTSRPTYPFVTDYMYDNLDRVTDVTYPKQWGNGQQPRKVVHHDYDIASRLSGLTYDGQPFASNIVYNAGSQTTSLNVGTGANQIVESYGYNAQTGLLENQTVAKTATPTTYLLNLSYDYANANAGGKRTGQLTKILNNLNPNKDRGYSYDALGRLVQATGGPGASPLWSQTYSYDRYGNRLSVSASGYSAKGTQAPSPAEQRASLSDKLKLVEPSTASADSASLSRWERGRGEGLAAAAPGPSVSTAPIYRGDTRRSHHASRSAGEDARAPSTTSTAPQSGPPTFTDDPLVAGTTVIKALHITELRDAINSLRQQRGLSAYLWQYSVTTNDWITANPIIEMRTALDQALGPPPSPGYATGLAQDQLVLAIHIQELRDRVKNNWNVSVAIPRDGHANLSYDTASNRVTTAGFEYDAAGNQVRALISGGSGSQRYRYDAANRLAQVRTDDNNIVIASYTYGDDNQRLITVESNTRTYYVAEGLSVIAEYSETGGSPNPTWSKSYVYLGNRLLSTLTPNPSLPGSESIEYHHPDRLGTRLVTNPTTGVSFEQVTLPFGTALNAESTGETNRRFTSYDRSSATKLDYAVNRHYDAQQGRFTQVDPIGMRSVSLSSPQTLNLYAYCTNDPINRTDPDGLGLISFFKKVLRGIAKILTNKWVLLIAGIALGLLSGFAFYLAFSYATVNTTFLAYGIALAAMSALLIVGAFHQGFLRVVQTIGGVVSSIQGAVGAIRGTINGGILGTPPWNPDATAGPVSSFMAAQRRRRPKRDEVKILLDNIALARRRLGAQWSRFIEHINKNKDSRISTKLLLCHASQESSLRNLELAGSGFMETTIGPLDEVGLLQILPSTARDLGVDPAELTDVALNVRTGTRYLADRIRATGSVAAGLRAYKGPGPSAAPYANEIIQCTKRVQY